MLNISETTKKLMESEVIKYSNLHEYAAHFINNDGISENAEYLPKLIIWIRKTTDDQPDCFNMDDETYEEFVCWGIIPVGETHSGDIWLRTLTTLLKFALNWRGKTEMPRLTFEWSVET